MWSSRLCDRLHGMAGCFDPECNAHLLYWRMFICDKHQCLSGSSSAAWYMWCVGMHSFLNEVSTTLLQNEYKNSHFSTHRYRYRILNRAVRHYRIKLSYANRYNWHRCRGIGEFITSKSTVLNPGYRYRYPILVSVLVHPSRYHIFTTSRQNQVFLNIKIIFTIATDTTLCSADTGLFGPVPAWQTSQHWGNTNLTK